MSSSWTPRPASAGGFIFLKLFLRDSLILSGFFCLLLGLSACGDSSGYGTHTVTSSTDTSAPPGSAQRPLEPGQLGRGLGPDGLPSLEPPKGVNVSVDTLFAEDIKDPMERIKRLENAVLELRRDYDATLPSIKRLVGIEKDMQALTAQLDVLTNGGAPAMPGAPAATVDSTPLAAATPAVAPTNEPVPLVPAVPETQASTPSPAESGAPAKTAVTAANAPAAVSAPLPSTETAKAQPPPQPPATAPPATLAQAPPAHAPPESVKPSPAIPHGAIPPHQDSPVAASGVRFGESGGKTRLVVDLNHPVTHRTDLDNDENLLVIELNGAAWNGAAKKTVSSPVIQSYETQPLENGKGTRLIFTLKKSATITMNEMLPPEAAGQGYRLVIDLKGK